MDRRRRPISAELVAPGGGRKAHRGAGPVWAPWLLAPLFALAPVAGCALAGKVKQSAIGPAAGEGALVAPAVTFADPPPAPAPVGAAVPVVPVAPARNR